MAPPLRQAFPRLTVAALSLLRKPTGMLGAWDQAPSNFAGSLARYASFTTGAGQQEAAPVFGAIPTTTSHKCAVVQVLTDPLRAQRLSAGTWRVAFGAKLANAGATYKWTGYAALFVVNGRTGKRRATVFNPAAVGSTARTATTEQTCLASVSGSAADLFAGDYLALELGVLVANTGASTAPQISIYLEGTGAIMADAAAATSAQASLIGPQDLLLSLPTPGEQPGASVTHEDAVRLVKEHFPPGAFERLYSGPIIEGVVEFLADVFKVYGWDQVDRFFREVNPLTVTELLPYWEGCVGITYGSAAQGNLSADERRRAFHARLRERGPLTLHNLAAAVGALGHYAAPALPEIYEVSGENDVRPANMVGAVVGQAVPVDTTFSDSNLLLDTPVLLDGGVVWDTGALIVLQFSGTSVSKMHFRLEAPDYTAAEWHAQSDGVSQLYLRSPAFAGAGIHGPWRLYVYRDAGAPANTLQAWYLYTLGIGWGGRAQQIGRWGVYIDSAHQGIDERSLQAMLDRVGEGYCAPEIIYALNAVPGTQTHRPGHFYPGA